MKHFVPSLEYRLQNIADGYHDTIVQTPQNKVGIKSMPYTDHKEHQDIRDRCRQDSAQMFIQMTAAEFREPLHGLRKGKRIKNVIPHPGAQGNVPSAPEIPQGNRKIRLAEVLHHADAKQLCHSHHHVNAAGKIPVELCGIHENSQYDHRTGQIVHRSVKNRADFSHQHLRDDIFLHGSEQKQQQRSAAAFQIQMVPFIKLLRHLIKPVDRSLQHLREEGYKSQELKKVCGRLALLIIYIHQVTNGLKGIKGNAQRQQQPADMIDGIHRSGSHMTDTDDGIQNVVPVFKITQNAKIK